MHPMLKLMARNQHKGHFKAETGQDGDTIYLYDFIVDSDAEATWWGGVSPQKFIQTLNGMTADTIHVRVNSPGGSVFAARAIEQAIREHSSRIIVHVDGYAASAASFLIMAADEIKMAPGAFIMIHKAWTIAFGNADELLRTAGLLEQIDGSLVRTYAERTEQDADEITAWMQAETWFDAERAVELGFADEIVGESDAKAMRTWDLSAYSQAPAAAPAADPIDEPASEPDPNSDECYAARHRAVLARLIPA